MLWLLMPRRLSSSRSFMAVVVLPLPEGPDSSTMGLRAMLAMIFSAVLAMRSL